MKELDKVCRTLLIAIVIWGIALISQSFGYNLVTSGFDTITQNDGSKGVKMGVPVYGNYQIYCKEYGNYLDFRSFFPSTQQITWTRIQQLISNPKKTRVARRINIGSHVSTSELRPELNSISWPHYEPYGGGSLPPAMAYIISDEPIGQWSDEKQVAIWNLKNARDENGKKLDGNILVGGTNTAFGSSIYDQEAIDYANYDAKIKQYKGMNPKDQTNASSVKVGVDQSTKEYTVGPFQLDYLQGTYGNITFAGISNMVVTGYNASGSKVKDNIKIDKFIIGSGKAITPKYFKPSSDLKVDEEEQRYPKSGEKFYIVFKDPNGGVSSASSRVCKISIEVQFQYMTAQGQYVNLRGAYAKVGSEHAPGYDCNEAHKCNSSCYEYYYDEDGRHREKVCNYRPNNVHDCQKQTKVSVYNLQESFSADADRTIHDQKVNLVDKEKIDITMDLGGRVWEDERQGKESLLDGVRGDSEKNVSGIPVILYSADGKRIGSTTTNGQGKYEFTDLDAMKKYYVEFQYNGQQYENTVYADILDGRHSTATETTSERDAFNNRFAEINGKEGYTKEQLDYSSRYYNAPSMFTISAYTGSDGRSKLVKYPKQNQFVVDSKSTSMGGKRYNPIYQNNNSVKNIDFGITRRIEFDMAVKKDVYAATVKINGKTEVYGYDKRNLGNDDGQSGDTWTIAIVGGYNRALDNADWDFAGINGNTSQLLEVYVTYKIAVRNQSMSILGHVTKLYDYYDSTYEYQPNLSWQSSKNSRTTPVELNKLQDCMEQGRIDEKSFGSAPKVLSNQNQTVTIDVNKKQATGETQYIYLTFKVKKQNNKVTLGQKMNKVEIGSFRTYYRGGTVLPHYNGVNNYKIVGDNTVAGRVDRDSIPSSMGRNGTPKEDDEDAAPGLNVTLTGEERKLNGTVWEDERTQKSGESSIGNGIMDKNESKIAGVQVQLVEKTSWNGGNPTGEYVWQTTTTNAEGRYEFKGYIPGDYVVRFVYGEGLSSASKNNGKSYNGQDYKSTIYQAGITQTATTDIDGKYKGYTQVTTQNETGTYGYNISTKKENVSDAKDIWSRREAVNNYSKQNVTNHKAEVLASPYVTQKYNGKEYTVAEKEQLRKELIDNTTMTAESGVVVIEVERNMQSNLENGKPSYSVENLNLGLVERPKAQLEIDKSITNLKITLANGSILFDVNKAGENVIWKDHAEYNLASKKNMMGKYEDYYGKNGEHRYSYRDEIGNDIMKKADKGLVQLTMDEELMHGATIEISYKMKVTNVGEVDYEGQRYYYLGDNSGANVVTTVANQVVDYIANNLQFNGTRAENQKWTIIQNTNLIPSQGVDTDTNLINRRLDANVKQFNTIIQTDGLNKVLKPAQYENGKIKNASEASTEKALVLTQLITTDNKSDDLTYSNIIEIVKTSNTVGRRMAYSVVGNQDPKATDATEVDASRAERVVILPPFGNTHIMYILGAVVTIMLAGGIILIIKKVLKR